MAPMLPPDIILLICEELGHQRAFGTLFNAALSSKQIAASALLWMYRVHHTSAIGIGDNTEDEMPKSRTANSAIFRWAVQWRSIILSSFGETAYPYCLYIRSLDLTNLNELFDDLVFKRDFETKFFEGGMSVLKKSPGATTRRPKLNRNSIAIVDMIGEMITEYAGESAERSGGTAALEELRGDIQKDSLPKWVRRLPRLKSLTLWRGFVLNATVADAIRDHCPDFDSLTLYFGLGPEVDTNLSYFFMGLRTNTLRSLSVVSYHNCGPQTFLSLSNHHASLKSLSLGNLQEPALSSLSLLKGCTAIESLDLQDLNGRTDLEATENDVFLEIISWLTSCKQLKNIHLSNFVNGPQILTSVCLEHSIKLDSLHLTKYTLAGNQDFHRALAHQTSLTSLYLKGDAEDAFRDDTDVLVTSVGKLKNLKCLSMLDISDYFKTSEIQLLALNLPKLEDLLISGTSLTNEVFLALQTLQHLHTMTFHAVTSFTYAGIMSYIATLRPGASANGGLQLSVLCADAVTGNLSPAEIADIRRALKEGVDGRFEFVLYREGGDGDGEEEDEWEGESD